MEKRAVFHSSHFYLPAPPPLPSFSARPSFPPAPWSAPGSPRIEAGCTPYYYYHTLLLWTNNGAFLVCQLPGISGYSVLLSRLQYVHVLHVGSKQQASKQWFTVPRSTGVGYPHSMHPINHLVNMNVIMRGQIDFLHSDWNPHVCEFVKSKV